ncbi:MAG: glycosyltransferase family 39 protein, partial [candidate division Zixibacteria bacterium]|nr:glycosyltransferase family 39 protein [candidate division Zixibacteria bacterium]
MAFIEKDRPWLHRGGTAVILLFVLAILFNWPYLTGDFFGDDLIFLNLMDDNSADYPWWRGVWSVNHLPFMDNIWWKEFASAGKSGIFWRPLPSLAIEASLYLFGRTAFPLHLLAILFHGAVAALLYLLVRNLTGRHGLAFLAGLFFVACEDLSIVIGWIATITDVFCVLFIMLALLAHVHWLKRRR